MKNLLIKGGTIVRSTGEEKADILIEDGVILEIGNNCDIATLRHCEEINAEGKLVFPGLIDCHVHFREPGGEHKATMETESAAAIAGGVTTVCDMPNTSPPTCTVKALKDKIERAEKIESCDIFFFFGVTEAEHLTELKKAWDNEGIKKHIAGVKIYLDHSTGNQKIEGGLIDETFKVCSELGIPLVAHCEDSEINAQAAATVGQGYPCPTVALHSDMRPSESEAQSIADAIELVQKYKTHFHVAHLSTKGGLTHVRKAKAEGLPITCEVAPHHLLLSTDDYEDLGTLGKMNPPLRSKEDQKALWEGVADGTIDCIATDHAPHTLEEKQSGEPLEAPSGVPGVETMLSLLLTVVAGKTPGFKMIHLDIARLCFENPNRIFNLGKEGIEIGAPADIVIVDPQKEWEIHGKDLHSKCGWTPFEGWKVVGKVHDVL